MDSPTPLVCQGRPVDRNLQPSGPACGTTFGGYAVPGDGAGGIGWLRWPTDAQRDEQARAAGWSVPADAPPMCKRCRRPDPAIARGLTRPAPADRTTEPRGTTK